MVASFKLSGGRRLAKRLRDVPKRVEDDVARAALKGAEEIATMQRALVPRDDGDLARSIHVTRPGQSTPAHSQPGGRRVAGPMEAIVTAGNDDVRYAHLVEYGTAPHTNAGQRPGTQHPGTAAQPYFWPGYRLVRQRVVSRVKRAISKAIKRESGL